MYCSSCGTRIEEEKLRCPECQRFTPALWLNLYSLSILAVLSLTNIMHVWKMVPIVANMATGMGYVLPLPMRMYIHWVIVSEIGTLSLLALVFPALYVLKVRKVRVPSFVTSGKALAVITWGALVFSLVGIFVGYIEVLRDMPRFIS